MAESTDIRDWARAHGKDIGDRGRIPADVRAEYEAAQVEDGFVPLPDPELVESPPFANGRPHAAAPPSSGPDTRSDTSTGGADETPPKSGPKRKWYQRPPRDDEPKRDGKRKSAERPAGWVWRGLAYLVGPVTPTGRVMELQEPVAGMILDDLIAYTFIDKVIQPFLKAGESAGEGWALLGPPACVYVMERFPESMPVFMPLLEDAIEGYLAMAGPLMAKAKRRQAAALKALKEFPEREGGAPATVQDLIADIFAGWQPTSNLSDEVVEEEAGAAA